MMNIFNLNATKRLVDLFNNQDQNTLLTYLNWLQINMRIDWIHGVIFEYDSKIDLIYVSNRGSLLYMYLQKVGGNFKFYEDNKFENFKDFENFIKINRYIILSKYEGVQNVYNLSFERIISIINFPPYSITSLYLQHVSDILAEYLDTKNKLDTITDTYYVFRSNMTQNNNNLIKMCQQKEDEKKALNKMISDTKELLKIKSI